MSSLVLVHNITGKRQTLSPAGIRLEPDQWLEVEYQQAIALHKFRVVELVLPSDTSNWLWKESDGTHLYWMSPFSLGDGYATAAEHMVHALVRLGLKLSVAHCWFLSRFGLLMETCNMLDKPLPGPHKVGFCMATPGEFRKLPTPYKIGLTMYEADDPLYNHPEWRHDCAVLDELVVPSEYCRDIFSTFVTAPISVAPLVINPVYAIGPETHRVPKPTFTFGLHGTLCDRKGSLELIDLFSRVFPKEKYPDARLQLKTRLGVVGRGENDVPQLADPRIKVLSESWLPIRMARWLKSLDCYVFPSKGEGFGLPPREAMSTGCPTIFSNHTGLAAIANPEYNWPIGIGSTEPSPLGGIWRIPDWDEMADAMLWTYNNREAAYEKGRQCSEWFLREFSEERVARQLLNIIEEVDPGTPKSPGSVVPERLEDHSEFLERLTAVVTPPATVLVLGDPQGFLHSELQRRGYTPKTVTPPGTEDNTISRLSGLGVSLPEVIGANPLELRNLSADAFASISYLHQFSYKALPIVLAGMCAAVGAAGIVMISVPTVYYPGGFPDGVGEGLHRMAWWNDTLGDFEHETYYYGPNRRYMSIRVHRLSPGKWLDPTTSASWGRFNDGVWHSRRLNAP